jgi:hypothetical protein
VVGESVSKDELRRGWSCLWLGVLLHFEERGLEDELWSSRNRRRGTCIDIWELDELAGHDISSGLSIRPGRDRGEGGKSSSSDRGTRERARGRGERAERGHGGMTFQGEV